MSFRGMWLPPLPPYLASMPCVRCAPLRIWWVQSACSYSNPQTFDISEVVADTGRVLRGAIGEDVDFVVELDPAPCHVVIDGRERILVAATCR